MRQTLRKQLDAIGLEADRLRTYVFLSAEERQRAGERLKQLEVSCGQLQIELESLARGTKAQIRAGWL